jgi:hypothetical protein
MGTIIGMLFQAFTFVIHQSITVIYAIFVDKLWHSFNRQRLEENSTFSLENQQKRLKKCLLICLEQDFYKHNQIKSAIEHLEEIAPSTPSFNNCNNSFKHVYLLRHNQVHI